MLCQNETPFPLHPLAGSSNTGNLPLVIEQSQSLRFTGEPVSICQAGKMRNSLVSLPFRETWLTTQWLHKQKVLSG